MSAVHQTLLILKGVFNILAVLCEHWRYLLIAYLIFSPLQPHIRWSDDYYLAASPADAGVCEYVGLYGFTELDRETCPAVRFLSVKPWWQA